MPPTLTPTWPGQGEDARRECTEVWGLESPPFLLAQVALSGLLELVCTACKSQLLSFQEFCKAVVKTAIILTIKLQNLTRE